jgi:hypothetical protein
VKGNQRFGSGRATTTFGRSSAATREPEIIFGVPVEAAGGQIDGIVECRGRSSGVAARRPWVEVVRLRFEMEAAPTDHGDRLTEGSGDGGEKLLMRM